MKHRILLLLIIGIIAMSFASALTINNVSITPLTAYKNDTLQGWCNASSSNNITQFNYSWYVNSLNISSGISYNSANIYCYQESENISNQTGIDGGCDLSYLGINSFSGNFDSSYPYTKCIDGNYSTYCGANNSGAFDAYVNSTFIKENGSLSSSKLYFVSVSSGSIVYNNISISQDCWDYSNNNVSFFIHSHFALGSYNKVYCNNGTDLKLIYSSTISTTSWKIYDWAMNWDTTSIFNTNISYNIANLSNSFVKNDNITFSCNAYNGTDYSGWSNSSVLTISNSLPIILSSRISPTSGYKNTTFQSYCNASDVDGDMLLYNYSIFLNAILNLSGNSSYLTESVEQNVYNFSDIIKGTNVSLQCLAFDGTNYSSALNSSTLVVSNSLPVFQNYNQNITLHEGWNGYTNNSLFWIYSEELYASDICSFSNNITVVSWYNSSSQTTNSHVCGFPLGNFSIINSIKNYLSIYSNDNITLSLSFDDQSYSLSHTLNVSNITINATDIDGDALTFAINDSRFTINSTTGLINKTNNVSTVGTYNVTVNISDGTNITSMWVFFMINNTVPTSVVNILNKPLADSQNITVNISISDIDGDIIVYNETRWYLNGTYNSSFDNLSEINNSYTADNETWIVSARVFDGVNWSNWVNDSVVIGDTIVPTINSLYASSNSVLTTDTLVIYANLSDNGGFGATACTFSLKKSDYLGYAEFNLTTNTLSGALVSVSQTMATFGTGTLEWTKVYCSDLSGNQANNLTVGINITISAPSTPPNGGGGGGGEGDTIIISGTNLTFLYDPVRLDLTVYRGWKSTGQFRVINKNPTDTIVHLSNNVPTAMTLYTVGNIRLLDDTDLKIPTTSGLTNNYAYIKYVIDTNLSVGVYSGNITLTSGGKSFDLPVVVRVKANPFDSEIIKGELFGYDICKDLDCTGKWHVSLTPLYAIIILIIIALIVLIFVLVQK